MGWAGLGSGLWALGSGLWALGSGLWALGSGLWAGLGWAGLAGLGWGWAGLGCAAGCWAGWLLVLGWLLGWAGLDRQLCTQSLDRKNRFLLFIFVFGGLGIAKQDLRCRGIQFLFILS